MDQEIKVCTYCSKEDNPKSFDLTGRLFCNLVCFQTFYKERNINNITQSHEQLFVQDILKINEQDNKFIVSLDDKDDETQLKIIGQRIDDLVRLQQSMRLSEMNLKRHTMKIRDRQESIKTERYRKEGCNSDLELREKRTSKLGKNIIQYQKMNMNQEQIVNILTSITKFTREEIIKEMESL